ncbi:hypothetical protein GCM10018790_69780 [Kitasatospora xanthocidica]|uniref:hypothetical protein n=1 Tax=Kitasatospora xanthocidica TaxID=83382 RepID=UPI00167738BE|nr:hypothetical protein [Kitasatospora xanthocidica]GHF82093.1 hypothetical protein GCM10018790_69780 [Kitasatospora xanthocidica]
MARMKPLVLTALAATIVLAGSTATAVADNKPAPDDKPVGKPAVAMPNDPTAANPSLLAAHAQVFGDWVVVPPGSNGVALVACPSGQVPTGGGGQTSGIKIFFTDSFPSGSYWFARGTNTNTVDESIRASAVCTTP